MRLLTEMGAHPREVLRTGEAIYKELGLDRRDVSDAELIDLMLQHPDLLQRPILEVEGQAVLGRPIERIAQLLDQIGGKTVIRPSSFVIRHSSDE